jgi:UDP-3-O-[3-hydroxymyristoyl] N-acetylglucosamine deacetylase
MAALAIARIDNAVIDVFGPEIPILDGSAAPFLSGLEDAGRRSQNARRDDHVVREGFGIRDGEREISFEPSDHFSLYVEIDFEDCLIGRQTRSISLSDADEIAKLASARTFCRLHEVDVLRRAGLIQGGSLENSIVVDGERLLNGAGLRDPNEFVLHKALDLIGDLYLLGMPIRAAIRAVRPGHDINCRAALALSRYANPARATAVAGA